jgi:hypothetical protein
VAAAAVAVTVAGIAVSAAFDRAVRAEVSVAGEGQALDVRRIRIVDDLRAGRSYRLPAFRIRNHRGIRTAYRLVVVADRPRRWLRFTPATAVIDAGRSRPVGVRLELPHDAEPGTYTPVLAVRPGDSEGARLTFRIEPAEDARAWLRQAENLAMWLAPALAGALVIALLVRS